MRASQRDHLWAFKRYMPKYARCCYVNMGIGRFPTYLKYIKFDLIIFDWSFVGGRVERARFQHMLQKVELLKTDNFEAIKICMPQDEFTSMDLLCDFINDFKINHVFSVAPPTEWKKIYRTVDFNKVKFIQVLTGYLDDRLVAQWAKKSAASKRLLDIGYRTVSTAIWGRFNLLKATISELFAKEAVSCGFAVDIKVGTEYFKMGESWLRFLAQCRFTLGIEGGSRILDWDGSILLSVSEYLKQKPSASLDELALSCVPIEREGEINVVVISPRHLEACLTRTVQILIEGEYNGILEPDIHYIPLKSDFSNLSEVLERIGNEQDRCNIAETAYRDIVSSQKYTYRSMVKIILQETGFISTDPKTLSMFQTVFFLFSKVHLTLNLLLVYLISRLRVIRNGLR